MSWVNVLSWGNIAAFLRSRFCVWHMDGATLNVNVFTYSSISLAFSLFSCFFFLPSVWPLHHWALWLIHIILCTISFSFPDLVLASVPFRIFEESYSNSMSLHVCRVIVISQMQIKCFYLWAWDLVSQMKLFYDHIVQLSFLIWELVE